MKKLLAIALFLCMLCTCAFAEEAVTSLNWSDIPEDVMSAGTFTEIEIPGYPTILCWIPGNMAAVDVSAIEAEVVPYSAFQTEDGAYSVSVFALQVSSVDEFLASLEADGAELGEIELNGIECISFSQAESGVEGVVIPMSDELVLSIACTPAEGDEDWDQVKGVIFASIQVWEEESTQTVVDEETVEIEVEETDDDPDNDIEEDAEDADEDEEADDEEDEDADEDADDEDEDADADDEDADDEDADDEDADDEDADADEDGEDDEEDESDEEDAEEDDSEDAEEESDDAADEDDGDDE